jgi:hypothetical protein
LIEIGSQRLVFMKRNAILCNYNEKKMDDLVVGTNINDSSNNTVSDCIVLVHTKTTDNNLTSIATALRIDPNPPPILHHLVPYVVPLMIIY